MRLISFHFPITGPAPLTPKTSFASKETPNEIKTRSRQSTRAKRPRNAPPHSRAYSKPTPFCPNFPSALHWNKLTSSFLRQFSNSQRLHLRISSAASTHTQPAPRAHLSHQGERHYLLTNTRTLTHTHTHTPPHKLHLEPTSRTTASVIDLHTRTHARSRARAHKLSHTY